MAKKRLTDSVLDDLVRQPPKSRLEYSDLRCPGLIVRANRTGKVTFTIVYRVSGGKLRRYTIGDWPDTDLSTARAEALRIVDEAHTGREEQLKKLEQAGETFELAWVEYVNNHLKHAAQRRRTVGLRTRNHKVISPSIIRVRVQPRDAADGSRSPAANRVTGILLRFSTVCARCRRMVKGENSNSDFPSLNNMMRYYENDERRCDARGAMRIVQGTHEYRGCGLPCLRGTS